MLKNLIAIFLMSALSATTCGAIAADDPQGTRPASEPAHELKLPKPLSYKLPNGMSVALLEDHRVPFVTFQLGIRVGDVNDPKDVAGLASMTADMLQQGTAKRTSKQIAEEIEKIGGGMAASADADFTVVSGSALSDQTDLFFDILSDVVLNPSFPEDELKLQKTNLIQALGIKRTDPDFLGNERFNKVVFGEHPYSVIAPSPQSVERITREGVIKFHKEHYLPNVSTLVVVGDFDTEQMKKLIATKFGDWKAGDSATTAFQNPPNQAGTKIYLVDRPGSVQSTVKIGNIGIKKNDPDYFKVMVANQILGGSANSRLFLNIRENKGYTYGAYSGFLPRRESGEFAASASVRTPVTAPSLLEFLYELNRIRTIPVTKEELETAKKYLIGNFQVGFETQGAVASRLLDQKLYDLPDDYLATYTSKIDAVTADDVRKVAHNHINYNNLVITVVGDAKAVKPELELFFPVEVYDTNGKLVRSDDKKIQPAS